MDRIRGAACAADFPGIHLANAPWPILAHYRSEAFVAEAASGSERISEMVFPVIGRLLAQRSSNRHLRRDGGAAATNQTAIGEDNWDASARCLERRIHAGATGANHQNIRLCFLVAHEPIESQRIRLRMAVKLPLLSI
jgi:hypothetical protein